MNEVALRDIGSLNPAAGAPVAHLTGTAAYNPTPEELKAIRAYVDAGGVLLIDPGGGSAPFAESMQVRARRRRSPSIALHVPPAQPPAARTPASPAWTTSPSPACGRSSLERTAASGTLRHLRSGKGAVILSELDVTSGLLGTETWGIFGYEPSYAQALVKNVIFWAMDGRPGLD